MWETPGSPGRRFGLWPGERERCLAIKLDDVWRQQTLHSITNTPPPGWVLPPSCFTQVKHGGGSISLWRCFSAGGKYYQILEDHQTQSVGGLHPEKIDFPARKPPHACSRSSTEVFRNHNLKVTERLSQSPDLSPIQNMCLDWT